MRNSKVTSMLVVLMFLLVTGIQAQTVTPSKKYITKELNNVSNFSSISVLGGTSKYPSSCDTFTMFTMLRPAMATLRS